MKTLGWIVFSLTLCVIAAAQPVTLADVSKARESIVRAKDLTDSDKSEISGLYDKAAQSLQQETRWRAQQAGQTRTKAVLQAELAAVQKSAALPLPPPPPAPPSETSQQVEEEAARVRADRTSRVKIREELSKLQGSLRQRNEEITTRRAAIRESLQSIEDEIAVLPLASPSPVWERASRVALQARRQALEQEFLALAMEREALDLRRRLIPLQREAHLLKLEADDQLLSELTVRKAKARLHDAKTSLDSTVGQAQGLAKEMPALPAIAADITTRATALWGVDGIEAKNDRVALQTEEMSASAARFKEITANTMRRYQNSSFLSPASDWWPPRVEKFGRGSEVRLAVLNFTAVVAGARRNLSRLEEERNAAPPLETQVQQLVASAGMQPGDTALAEFKSRARSILELRRSVMAEFLAGTSAYVSGLDEANRVARDLLLSIQELQLFVSQRVLWTRSVGGSILPSVNSCWSALLWLVSYRNWSQIIAGFLSAGAPGLLWLSGLIGVCVLFLLRHRLRVRLEGFALSRMQSGRIAALLSSTLAALLSALPAPLVIAYAGWMIGAVAGDVDLGRAAAGGAKYSARLLYLVLLVRGILATDGATHRLLGWSAEVRGSLDWAMRRVIFVCVPLFFVAAAFAEDGMFFGGDATLQSYHDSLGRLCFIAGVLFMFWVGRKVLRKGGAVARAIGTRFSKHGVARARVSRFGWNLVLSFAFLLALFGLYTTAYLLMQNLMRTAVLTMTLALAHAVIRQWRLAQEDRLTRSTAEEKARNADEQVRRLGRFGLMLVWVVGAFFIWSAVLPALALLKNVELLPEFKTVANRVTAPAARFTQDAPKAEKKESVPVPAPTVVPAPAPAPAAAAPVTPEPLYLSGLLLAVFVGLFASMLVRNIPGLLTFTVFQRLRLDEGGEYAVTTITRYIVMIAGLLTVSGILGLNWSKVQWLAAALTFGIGFGLQEIFANFASGLILLLDRSIRVGDAVSVGTLSGVVARIQMRATTVTLWDHSDMIVPNKEFITTKLVNWTLSNPDTRVDLKVGVDYGSDVEQVREVLMRLAEQHPAVLKDPAPQVLLTEFGESAIQFELRVFGLYSYGRPVLLDELYRAVVKEFRHLGIVIAFPQLDIRLSKAAAAHQT